MLGFLSVLAIFAMVTLFSYGVLPTSELASARQPSMGTVLESVVGPWGSTFISFGVVISVLGAYLAWTLMAAEVMYIPATNKDMPRFLGKMNRVDTPIAALILSTIAVQVLLLITLASEDALNFMLDLCTSLALVPYFLAAAYALKLGASGDTYESEPVVRRRHVVIGAIATAYTLLLVFTAGATFLLLTCVIYAPGTILTSEPGARTACACSLRGSSPCARSSSLVRLPAS